MTIVDSNVWIAFFNKDDTNHKKAEEVFWQTQKVILPEYVILETTTVLAQKASKESANDFLKFTGSNQDVGLLPSSAYFLESCVSFYISHASRHLSFVDCSLLYLSEKFSVITFDEQLLRAIEKRKKS